MEVLNSTDYSFLRGETPLAYWEDGRNRFNSVFPSPDRGFKNWMSPYYSNMTRNKAIGLIAHAVSRMMDSSIIAQNDAQEEDRNVAEFLKDIVEYSKRKENFDEKFFWAIVTSIAEGNVVLFDGYGPMGNLVKGKKRQNGAYTLLVPNEEFLRYDPYLVDVQEQEWVMWRRKLTYGRAKKFFGWSDNFDKVIPGGSSRWSVDFQEFKKYDSFAMLSENEVEIVQRWKKDGDKTFLDIAANGVQLTEEEHESERRDGQYPFAEGGGEPMDAHFFMRQSMTKKLEQEQDEGDHLWRLFINMTELQMKPPVAVNRPELASVDIVIPGNVVPVGENENYKVTPIMPQLAQGFTSGGVNLIEGLKRNADESSVNPQQLGGAQKGTNTATESSIIAQNADVMMGLFGRELSYLHRDWLRLRCQTCLWQLKNDVDFAEITVYDRILKSGKTGKRKYKMEPGLSEMIGKAKEGAEEMKEFLMKKSFKMRDESKKSGGKEESVMLDPEDILDMDIYVFTDGEPQPKKTGVIAKAMAMEDWQIYSQRPDVFNQNEAAEDLVKARGGDPARLVLEPQSSGVPALPGGELSTPPSLPTNPNGPSKQLTGSLNRLAGNDRLTGA